MRKIWFILCFMLIFPFSVCPMPVHAQSCKTHTFTDWIKLPQCGSKGVQYRQCLLCSHKQSQVLEPVEHRFSDTWQLLKPATCTQEGTQYRFCIRPGCSQVLYRTIPKKTHSFDQKRKCVFCGQYK